MKYAKKLNKKAILAAIRADGALCEGDLVNGRVPGCNHVGRCAMGAILFHNGMTNKELKELPSGLDGLAPHSLEYDPEEERYFREEYNSNFPMDKAARKVRRILWRLGMTQDVVEEIMTYNDTAIPPTFQEWWQTKEEAKTWRQRAKAVIKFIKSL